MRDSAAVAEALTTFFAKNASGDLSTYDGVVSKEEAAVVHPEWWEAGATTT